MTRGAAGISGTPTEADEAIKVVNGRIVVSGNSGAVTVFNAAGTLIYRGTTEAGGTELPLSGSGVYIVRTGNGAVKKVGSVDF